MTTTRSRSHARTRLVFGALASSALLVAPALLAAGPASAEGEAHRVVHRDARADVLLFPEGSETGKPAPGDRATDVVKTVVDHRADQLVVEARVRQLSRSGYRLMIAEILTSSGKRYQLARRTTRPSRSARASASPGTPPARR